MIFGCSSIAQNNSYWQPANKQEIISSYKNVCNWFINTNSYSFELKYTSYKNHSGGELIESSSGYYKRSGNKYVTEAVGIKTIQNDRIRMIVDTSDKVIAITKPGTLAPTMQSGEDLNKLLDNVKTLRKKSLNKLTTYRLDFNKNELYEAYEFTINDKGMLEKLVYYYTEQTEKEYGDGEEIKPSESKIKPRLDISFFNYLLPAKVNESDFQERSIVLAANDKVSLINKYKSYTLKDYRVQAKK